MKVFILICLLIVILLCSCLNKNNIIEEFATWNPDGTVKYTMDDGYTYEFDFQGGQKCSSSPAHYKNMDNAGWTDVSACFYTGDDPEQIKKQQECYKYGIQYCKDKDSTHRSATIWYNGKNDYEFACYDDYGSECSQVSNSDEFLLTFDFSDYTNGSYVNNIDSDCNNLEVGEDDDMLYSYSKNGYVQVYNDYNLDMEKDDCGVCDGDNSSCTACMNPESCNYDENADFHDPLLCDDSCYVCNDTSACNYTTSITTEDGSITYGVGGDYEVKEDNNLCGYYSDCDDEIGQGVCPKDEYGNENTEYENKQAVTDNCGNCVPNDYKDSYGDCNEVNTQYTGSDGKKYDCCYTDDYGNNCNTFNECGICDESIASGDSCSAGNDDGFYCLDSEKDDCGYCPENTDKYNNSKGCDDICDSELIFDDCGECNGSNFYITKSYTEQGDLCSCDGLLIDACGVCGGNIDNEEDCSLSDDKDNVSIILYFTEIDVNVWDVTYLSLYPFWKVEMNGVILDTKSNNYPYYDYPYSSGLITSYDINDGLTINTEYNDESLFEETGSSREYTPQTLVRFDGHIKDLSVKVYDGNKDNVEADIILQ